MSAPVIAYALPGVLYCCVCGERPWADPAMAPVFPGDCVAASMTSADRCAECGDALIHDDEGGTD